MRKKCYIKFMGIFYRADTDMSCASWTTTKEHARCYPSIQNAHNDLRQFAKDCPMSNFKIIQA